MTTKDALSALDRDIAARKPHYEVWSSTPTHANIVGGAHTLLGALTLYLRARRAERDHTINVLVNAPSPDRSADTCGC